MSDLLLFHHALGLTDGVRALAGRFRDAGHTVHTPDLFEGQVFADLEDGLGYFREIGFGALVERGAAVAEVLPADVVYAGLSLGVIPAQYLAQKRPGARGAALLHACLPAAEFGAWPDDVPVQVHGMVDDPFFAEDEDRAAAEALVAEVAAGELFLYPGGEHLFTDSSLPSYDADATARVVDRVLRLLRRE